MATSEQPAVSLDIDFNGNPAQGAFVRDRNHETAYIGGVGSGKTVAGLMRMARHIFEWNPGEQLAIVAPTVPMTRNVIIPEMQRWGLLGQEGIEYRSSENVAIYPNGTRLILESANNERKIQRLEGLNLAAGWLDEIAQHEYRTYTVLGDRLRTGEYRNLFMTGTPKGMNWVYDELVDIDVDETETVANGTLIRNANTTTIYGVSTEVNKGNPEDYIEARKRQHTGAAYEQEVLGQFTQFEGLVYSWFAPETHVLDSADVPDRGEYDEVIYGVDWGHNNPATITAVVRQGDTWVVVEEFYERRQTVNDHSRALEQMQTRWGNGPAYCDPSEPANIDTFQRDGINAQKAKNDVTPGIQHVTSVRADLRVAPSCQELRNEFAQYRYKDGDESDSPVKESDHLLDALRYCLFTHLNPDQTRRGTGTF